MFSIPAITAYFVSCLVHFLSLNLLVFILHRIGQGIGGGGLPMSVHSPKEAQHLRNDLTDNFP